MKEQATPGARGNTVERILATASAQFAAFGYNGASTRDIAAGAGVNEVTIYRHYPRKRNLYLAALDAELSKISLHGDLLASLAAATDGRTALERVYRLIALTIEPNTDLMRLLHYGSLELSDEIDPLIRRHLGEPVKVLARYLEPWVANGELRAASSQSLILALVAMVLMDKPLNRIFPGGSPSGESLFHAGLEICLP
jgi:AcrR family transcriptional regulator